MSGQFKNLSFSFRAPKFSQTVNVIQSDFVVIRRQHQFYQEQREIDTYAGSWILLLLQKAFTKGRLGTIYRGKLQYLPPLQQRDDEIQLPSLLSLPSNEPEMWACFLPPFSLVEWVIPKGQYEWIGFMSEQALPCDLSRIYKQAVCFSVPQNFANLDSACALQKHLQKTQNIFELLRNAKTLQIIEKQDRDSIWASKVKQHVDKNFQGPFLINKMAEDLRRHRVYLGREFQKCYSITPIEYRNRLRVFESLRQMRHGNNVTTAGFESGFESLNRFQQQFKKIMTVQPSEFCLNKKIPKSLQF